MPCRILQFVDKVVLPVREGHFFSALQIRSSMRMPKNDKKAPKNKETGQLTHFHFAILCKL